MLAFNIPDSITRGTSTAQFFYGPDRTRYKRVDSFTAGTSLARASGTSLARASGTTTTLYIGGKALEEITAPVGAVTQKHRFSCAFSTRHR